MQTMRVVDETLKTTAKIDIVSVFFNPMNKFQVYVVTSHAWTGLFDYFDGVLLQVGFEICD